MRESIKVIKWCSLISVFFLVLTYVVTVNSEGHFFVADSVWISNNFFLTLFGGAFASMLVVVLCEIQKYLSAKASTKQYLFYQSLYLYQALMQMKVIIKDYQQSECIIPKNLFDDSVKAIQSELNALEWTDFVTFRQDENSLTVEHGRFCKNDIPRIRPILQSGIQLRLAINETEIGILQKNQETHTYSSSNRQITSKCPKVAQILNFELETVSSAIKLVESYICKIDNYCKNRYKWDDIKEKLNFYHIDDISKML